MGDVWLADDSRLGRRVAMKFVNERELEQNPGASKILQDEAKTAGSLLGHPNIVSVLDLFNSQTSLNQGPVLVMEYVDGCNLGEWIAKFAPAIQDEPTRLLINLYIALQAVDAIGAAHKMGVLHRDIKPQNVLCSKTGQIKVADFGLSRLVEAITRTHTVWGRHTPLYAAPEQWNDEKPDEKTDIYQLCSTVYHLLAGTPVNPAKNLMGLLQWHKDSVPHIPLEDAVKGIDPAITKLVNAGLSRDRAERPDIWQLFDALSTSLMGTLRLKVTVENLSPAAVSEIAKLTDYTEESILDDNFSFEFPNPLEPLQEAVGVVILGGQCVLSRVEK